MNVTFESVVNTILFSSIAILLLRYLISSYRMVSRKGYTFIAFISVLIICRLFFPIELRFMQSNVYLTKIYPEIYLAIKNTTISFYDTKISFLSLLISFAIVGSVICFIRLILSYITIRYQLSHYPVVDNSMIYEIYHQINATYKNKTEFQLVTDKNTSVPFLFGLFKPIIVLPDITLSEEEWHYILSHEIKHFYHKDLWIRFCGELLKVIYWWNPFVYLLQKQLIHFQEFRVDTSIIQNLDKIQQLDYLDCLVKMAKIQSVKQEKWIASFNSKSEIPNRIKRLLHFTEESSISRIHILKNTVVSILLIIFVLFLPNFIILEPKTTTSENFTNTKDIVNNNSYFLLQENGTYDVYMNGEYFGTVSNIFDDSLKVINWKGEVIYEKKEPRRLNNLFEYTF